MTKDRLTTPLILLVTAIFILGVGWSTMAHEKKTQDEIAAPSRVLVEALEANDPTAGPEADSEYVKGIRKHFGRIREARFLDAYTERNGSHKSAQTDVVSEILVRGKRGVGVLELDFDGAKLTGVWELEPGNVHSDLSPEEERAHERGFARRGGKTAGPVVLSGA